MKQLCDVNMAQCAFVLVTLNPEVHVGKVTTWQKTRDVLIHRISFWTDVGTQLARGSNMKPDVFGKNKVIYFQGT